MRIIQLQNFYKDSFDKNSPLIFQKMNYLQIPQALGNYKSDDGETDNLIRKDSFSSSINIHPQSFRLIPSSSFQHSSTFGPPVEQTGSKKNELQQLKQTLAQFNKSLEQAKYGQQRNITEKTQISYVIRSLFNYLKQIMKSSHCIQNFDWVVKNYINVLEKKENSQHFYTQVQGHLKQILGTNEFNKYKKNRKIYLFLLRLVKFCPHIIYKVLQNKQYVFDNQLPESLEVYKSFIKLTSQKANNSKILSYINSQIAKQTTSMEKFTILLSSYKEKLSQEMVEKIKIKIDELIINFTKYWKQTPGMQNQLTELINQFLSMDWPVQDQKNNAIINYIDKWSNTSYSDWQTQHILNKFLRNMPDLKQNKQSPQQIKQTLSIYIESRLTLINIKGQKQLQNQFSSASKPRDHKDYEEVFNFLNIIFQRCGRSIIQSIITQNQFKKLIQNVISQKFALNDGLILMLSTFKGLNIYHKGKDIQKELITKMKIILSAQKGGGQAKDVTRYSEVNFKHQLKRKESQYTTTLSYPAKNPLLSAKTINPTSQSNSSESSGENIFYCIRALRLFSFEYQSFWNIYSMIKRYIFKTKLINKYGQYFKKQVIKACLHIVEKLSNTQQCKNMLIDVIDIIKQEEKLKILFIKWSSRNQEFYNKKLYQIYNSTDYLQNLIHDYSSKEITIKRFSIKMLCLLYPYNQCQIIPFLKKAYYQIYERLSVEQLVGIEQKKMGLKLIREIINSRSEIVKDDSDQFASFLYNELCQIIKNNYSHHTHAIDHNELTIEILKTLVQMTKIMKQSILPYVRSLGFHLISLINSKITSPHIKRYCLQAFKQMTFSCGYVLIPYFYHRNLLLIFREILKSDDRNHDYRDQLMRLMGSFGFITKEKFFKLRNLTENVLEGGISSPQTYSAVQSHFLITFKEINYLKMMKKYFIFDGKPRQNQQIRQAYIIEQRQLSPSKQLKDSSRQDIKQQKQQLGKQIYVRQIRQIKPLPANCPYYSEQKVNYKISTSDFNYKKHVIQKVLQNMNQQSSSIIFYNTFKTLESFIFILQESEQKMYQSLLFTKILPSKQSFAVSKDKKLQQVIVLDNYTKKQIKLKINQKQKQKQNYIINNVNNKSQQNTKQQLQQQMAQQNYPLSSMSSLLVKIIFYQNTKNYANQLFHYFLNYIQSLDKRTLILQCLFIISSKNPDMVKVDIKNFLLKIRKIILELNCNLIGANKNPKVSSIENQTQIQHHIILCFGILTNLSAYLDNFLHLFLPDFSAIFIKRPEKICETYFSLLLNLFKNCPSTEQFLSEISDRMVNLLTQQFTRLKNYEQSLQKNQPLSSASFSIKAKIQSISFINNLIDFLISILLIFGDKFKGFSDKFHDLIKFYNYKAHIFYPVVQDFMKKHSSFNNLHYFYKKNELSEIMKFQTMFISLKTQEDAILTNVYKHQSLLNFATLSRMIQNFNCDQNQVQQQSQQWFTMLSISIFQKSQTPFIRACTPIIKEDKALCNDLFPMAFYFFWNILNNQFRKKLTMKLRIILENKGISLRVKQKFIDTIYFMEQQLFQIPIPDKILRDTSEEVLDLAKSLFYMEKLYLYDAEAYGEDLIKMYAEMGQSQSAVGLLGTSTNLNPKTKIELYQKLNSFKEALGQLGKLAPKDKKEFQNQLEIKIRKGMFQWDTILNKCQKLDKNKNKLSHYAVESAINLGKWDQVKKYLPYVDKNHEKSNLWRAMLSIYDKKYDQVQKYIKKDRQLIYPKICQLFNFSFQRKMEGVIRLQTLTQLEEANEYLKLESQQIEASQQEKKKIRFNIDQKKMLIDSVWSDRIEGANTNLWSMQQLLLSRSLLFTKGQDLENWIDYCKLALKQNQVNLCQKTLQTLMNQTKDLKDQNKKLKKKFTVQTLLVECKFMLGDLKDQEAVFQIQKLIEDKLLDDKGTSSKHHQYYYKCALWLSEKEFDFSEQKAKKSILLLGNAVRDFKSYIKGWHLLGLMHNRIIEIYQARKKTQVTPVITTKPSEKRFSTLLLSSSKDIQQSQLNVTMKGGKDKDSRQHDSKQLLKQGKQTKQKDLRQHHIFQALKCFIESVCCGTKNHQFFLQDCLKIMNIIFTEYEDEDILNQLRQQYQKIPSEGLIEIIPQIVGRLDIVDKQPLLDMMKKLLVHIGMTHPQTIIFPLIFCKKSGNAIKKKVADEIFVEIAKKQSKEKRGSNRMNQILFDAEKITDQLVKVSLKLNQKFYIYVNKIYQSSRDKGVCNEDIANAYCNFITKMLQEDFSSLSISEFGFIQQYKQEFSNIKKKLSEYISTKQTQFFKKAESKIIIILNQIRKSLEDTKKIFLEQVSPDLFNTKSSKVCLFGSYNPNYEPIYICRFRNELTIVNSKQRPKKLVLTGSNQKDYNFLLKGKQDLRLDERIMQLFSLINKMFHDPSERDNYSIKGYSITPISLQIGIISWVQNCDTIGELIIKERSSGTVYLEKKISQELCQYYHILTRAQKVQIYKQIEQRVSGTDLRNIFWIRSSNSQEWLRSRTCYIRSLAVMSIVGYIIGLGDRHPNNIMIQRDSGQVVHIDFGDCFDVNKMRKQYPERVPFRLTRMLVKAMELCGVQGIFKSTCQKMIRLLRNNKQSIIAIVQAFKYDPLIGWNFKKEDGNQAEGKIQHQSDDNQMSFLTGNKKQQKKQTKNMQFARHILDQIKKKLNGMIDTNKALTPEEQVQKLISEATSPQNLVEHYEGWQIYW